MTEFCEIEKKINQISCFISSLVAMVTQLTLKQRAKIKTPDACPQV